MNTTTFRSFDYHAHRTLASAALLAMAAGGCALQADAAPQEKTQVAASALNSPPVCTPTWATTYTFASSPVRVGGMLTGTDGNVYLTDLTHNAIVQIPPGGCPSSGCASWTAQNVNGTLTIGPTLINGPSGQIGFVGKFGSSIGAVGWLSPASGVSIYQLNNPGSTRPNLPTGALALGPDGNVYFAYTSLGTSLIGIHGPNVPFSSYSVPAGYSGSPTSIVEGPDGTMWFSTGNAIGQFACVVTSSKQRLAVNAPAGTCTPAISPPVFTGAPANLLTGPDGNLWFSDGSNVEEMTTAGTIADTYAVSVGSLALASDDTVWFGNGASAGQIAEWVQNGIYTFTVPQWTDVGPMVAGPDGNMWVVTLAVPSTLSNQVTLVTPCSSCITPAVTTVVTLAGGGYPASVVSDGTNAYFTNFYGGGSVQSVPRAFGDVATLAPNRSGPWGVAVDSSNVYWTEDGGGNGSVNMTTKTPGGTVATIASGQAGPRGIVLGGGDVYWTNTSGGEVYGAAPTANAALISVAQSQPSPFGITFLNGSVFWANQGTAGQSNGSVMQWTPGASGGPSMTLTVASGQNEPFDVALSSDEEAAVWTNSGSGSEGYSLRQYVPVGSGRYAPRWGAATTLSDIGARNVVVDGAWSGTPVVYFTDFNGDVWYQKKTGETCPLSIGENTTQGLAVDDTYVYWTNFTGSGVVRRANKVH
jgi:virginiamycin B lyase